MVEKENRSFIKQVPVTHYSRTLLRTAPSPCAPTRSPTCVSAAGLGPGHVPSVGLAERASWRSTAIWDGLLPAPPPLQKLALEGDSGASGVAIGLVGGSRAVGRGKVAGSGVRAPSSAVKNSLAGCHLPAAGGQSFSTRPRTSILHDPRGIPLRSENGWRSRSGHCRTTLCRCISGCAGHTRHTPLILDNSEGIRGEPLKFTYCFCAHMHEIVKYFHIR